MRRQERAVEGAAKYIVFDVEGHVLAGHCDSLSSEPAPPLAVSGARVAVEQRRALGEGDQDDAREADETIRIADSKNLPT